MKYLEWVKREVHFEQRAQEATLLDYLHEAEHAAARIARFDGAIEEAVKCAPPQMRAVIEALQGYEESRTWRRSPSSPNWENWPVNIRVINRRENSLDRDLHCLLREKRKKKKTVARS